VSRRTTIAAGVAFALASLVAAWVLWSGEPRTGFGWFAYEPLPDPGTVPDLVVMTGRRIVAVVVGAVGLLSLGFVAGFARGTRRHRS
jgi:hypothetical protein